MGMSTIQELYENLEEHELTLKNTREMEKISGRKLLP